MTLKKSDWYALAVIAAVLAALLFSALREKPKRVPMDEAHRPLLAALAGGASREAVEAGCADCHGPPVTPLPAGHPPKEQCLICHQALT